MELNGHRVVQNWILNLVWDFHWKCYSIHDFNHSVISCTGTFPLYFVFITEFIGWFYFYHPCVYLRYYGNWRAWPWPGTSQFCINYLPFWCLWLGSVHYVHVIVNKLKWCYDVLLLHVLATHEIIYIHVNI